MSEFDTMEMAGPVAHIQRRPCATYQFPRILWIWCLWATIARLVGAVSFNPVPPSNLDLSSLGQVGLVGDFDAISLYQFYEQNQDGYHVNGSQSVLARLPNGGFAPVAATDAYIHKLCPFVTMDGKLQGLLIAGNFTTVGGQKSQAIGLMDPSTGKVTPLPGLTGKLNTVYCDQSSSTVYVGGEFKGGNSTNAIAWVGTTGWANLPFTGFNGPVNTISKLPNGNMLFGGSFDALGNSASTPANQTGGSTTQAINLSSAKLVAISGSTAQGFSEPRNIICQTGGAGGPGKTWLLGDGTAGSWEASLPFGFRPASLRLWNTNQDGKGTKTFRFVSAGGILNLTYIDPETKQTRSCDNQCPLAASSGAQEFTFVNSIGMSSFEIAISDWYGSGAGLNGIELRESDLWTHAINDFNEPSCSGSPYPSIADTSGSGWDTVVAAQNAAAMRSDSNYVSASTSNFADPSITFRPDVPTNGNYSIIVWTPGCLQDSSCGARGMVNITVSAQSGKDSIQNMIYQTNAYDKYDEVYNGYLDAASSGFRPHVIISPASGQQSGQIVAQKLQLVQLSTSNLGSLNGLYEYNPSMTVTSTNFSTSAIDTFGMSLGENAEITSSVISGKDIFLAGKFSTKSSSNIVHLGANLTSLPVAGGGLNDAVEVLLLADSLLYVGGYFSGTADNSSSLNKLAVYDTKAGSFNPLGAGVNGRVCFINPLNLNLTSDKAEQVIVFSGDFDAILAFGSFPSVAVQGLAVWVPSQQNWLQNVAGSKPALGGKLASVTTLPDGSIYYAGTLVSQNVDAQGAVSLANGSNPELSSLGIKPIAAADQSNQKVVVTDPSDRSNKILSGAYNEVDGKKSTILGGHFSARDSNGKTVNNLVSIEQSNNNAVHGFGDGLDKSGTILALAAQNAVLYAGGNITGKAGDSRIDGLVVYDLKSYQAVSPHPPAFGGQSVTVRAITVRPNTNDIYVGGAFSSAGSVDCSGLCLYSNGQWQRTGSGFSGSVNSLWWTSERQLVVGGTMSLNSSSTNLASYDTSSQSWQNLDASGQVPGPVDVLTSASEDASRYWVAGSAKNGSAFLLLFDGQKWQIPNPFLNETSIIQSLQILPITQPHSDNAFMDQNHVLLVSGRLITTQYGQVSSLIFNGTAITPFVVANNGNAPGSISSFFFQHPYVYSTGGSHLAVGYVVLISLAIALALVFLMVVTGILANYVRRRREGYVRMTGTNYQHGDMQERLPPSELFGEMGGARLK